MGKHDGKDKAYITATESNTRRSGGGSGAAPRALTFDRCALTFTPWETPVATPDGWIFDLAAVVPFLRRYKVSPSSGAPLTTRDLVRLQFHKNEDGAASCPVTGRVFTAHTKLAALRPTGNVYAWDAIETLILTPKRWVELLTEDPITREDIMVLQDPSNEAWVAAHDVNKLFHLREKASLERLAAAASASGGSASDTVVAGGAGGGVIRASEMTRSVLAEVAALKPAAAAASGGGSEVGVGSKRPREDGDGGHVRDAGIRTTGAYGASLTSSALGPMTRNVAAVETEADLREKRWRSVAALRKKAYVQLATTHGVLNLELHCDAVPRTCDNFLQLARRGAYDRTIFHRCIRNFMIQGGDPTGTGSGGDSCWGGAFPDERSGRFSHNERGVVSMANAGANTNRSQFFITFKSAPHLDGKHTIFGRVVGGSDTLRAMEVVPVDKSDRPLERVAITKVTVFADPFAEYDAAQAAAASGAGASTAVAAAAPASATAAFRVSTGGPPAAADAAPTATAVLAAASRYGDEWRLDPTAPTVAGGAPHHVPVRTGLGGGVGAGALRAVGAGGGDSAAPAAKRARVGEAALATVAATSHR